MRYDRKVTDIIQGVKITGGFDTYASLPVANTPGVYHFILSVERPFDIVGFIRISITGVCMP